MKKLFVIAMLATVGMAACSKDDTAPAAGPKKYVQVTIPEDMVSGETRTSIDGTTTNWVAGDKVAVLLYDGAATMTCQFTADKSGRPRRSRATCPSVPTRWRRLTTRTTATPRSTP